MRDPFFHIANGQLFLGCIAFNSQGHGYTFETEDQNNYFNRFWKLENDEWVEAGGVWDERNAIWSVTEHKGTLYGFAYNIVDKNYFLSIYTSMNGIVTGKQNRLK